MTDYGPYTKLQKNKKNSALRVQIKQYLNVFPGPTTHKYVVLSPSSVAVCVASGLRRLASCLRECSRLVTDVVMNQSS